jgi:hypothetical protein
VYEIHITRIISTVVAQQPKASFLCRTNKLRLGQIGLRAPRRRAGRGAMLGRCRTLDTTRAERDSEPVRKMLKFERKLREQLYTEVDLLVPI